MDKLDFIDNPIYFDDSPIGFFDGVVDGGICGIGLFLKLSNDHFYKAHFAGGEGSNMKAEILGLWGLLHFAASLSINRMMVVGDSKVAIDWIKGKANLNLLYLSAWKDKIWRLKDSFKGLKFMHVHRIFNSVADQLSKKALKCTIGWM